MAATVILYLVECTDGLLQRRVLGADTQNLRKTLPHPCKGVCDGDDWPLVLEICLDTAL